jgi:hypothetical protein
VLFDAAADYRANSFSYQSGGRRGRLWIASQGGCGRNGRVLPTLARNSGVHLIACTGFHRRLYYPPAAPLWQMSAAAQPQTCLWRELTDALAGNGRDTAEPVRAGFIKIAGEATSGENAAPSAGRSGRGLPGDRLRD